MSVHRGAVRDFYRGSAIPYFTSTDCSGTPFFDVTATEGGRFTIMPQYGIAPPNQTIYTANNERR